MRDSSLKPPSSAGSTNSYTRPVGEFASWSNVSSVYVEDGASAFTDLDNPNVKITMVRLVKNTGGSPLPADFSSENKAGNEYLTASYESYTFGDETSLWGETWTPAIINNNSLFGVAVELFDDVIKYSTILYARGYNFNIPSYAKIEGIKTRIVANTTSTVGRIDFIEVEVFYSYIQTTGLQSVKGINFLIW